jgi:Mn-containing catalase
MLQQAIGGVEGRSASRTSTCSRRGGSRGPKKYRDMLLATGTEELAHIEMLATAVALTSRGRPMELQETAAQDGAVNAVLGGMNARHYLSGGLAALPENSTACRSTCTHIYASGTRRPTCTPTWRAEATGRVLAVRLYNMDRRLRG